LDEHVTDDDFEVYRVLLDMFRSCEEGGLPPWNFWHSRTPAERLRHMTFLNRLRWGDAFATGRMERVIEVVQPYPR
jgi:hypothetical protein